MVKVCEDGENCEDGEDGEDSEAGEDGDDGELGETQRNASAPKRAQPIAQLHCA